MHFLHVELKWGVGATSPHPQRQQGCSWTSHMPARTKCSPRSPQNSKRPAEREKHVHKLLGKPKPTTPMQRIAHCKMVDAAWILQQLLKGNGPAQDPVGWARLLARSAWKTQVCSTSSSCWHVQLYTTTKEKKIAAVRQSWSTHLI